MRLATGRIREEYAHEHYVSPPFDEDDELDLRALYRKTRSGSPELDAAVRRSWHPGHSWHPGWAAAACAFLVAGLFTWTNMRENADAPDSNPIAQLMAPSESGTDKDRPAAAESAVAQPQEAPAVQRARCPRRSPHCRHNRPPRGRNVSAWRRPARGGRAGTRPGAGGPERRRDRVAAGSYPQPDAGRSTGRCRARCRNCARPFPT